MFCFSFKSQSTCYKMTRKFDLTQHSFTVRARTCYDFYTATIDRKSRNLFLGSAAACVDFWKNARRASIKASRILYFDEIVFGPLWQHRRDQLAASHNNPELSIFQFNKKKYLSVNLNSQVLWCGSTYHRTKKL